MADYEQSLYKDTGKIILDNEVFFLSLSGIDRVVCFGLSFGDVDIPYLKRIDKAVKTTTKWEVYYHDAESCKTLKRVFEAVGISKKHEISFLQSNSFWDK